MYNKVIIIGRLTRDIELKYLPSGSAIAKCSIASNYRYKMQNGEQKDESCFLEFSIFGKRGEIFNQYVRKGSKVMLEGRLVFQQWKAQDGTNRSAHALNVSEFTFLDSKSDTADMGGNSGYNASQPQMNQPQQQNYNAPQQQYGQQQAQQQSYNPPQQQTQNSGMNKPSYEENIPSIDIDNDEIPF